MLLGALGGYAKRKQLPILKSFLLGWGSSTLGLLIILPLILLRHPYPERHGTLFIASIAIIITPIIIGITFVVSSNPLD